MRIVVTGASGLLGRATVERLRADGHEVVGFDVAGTPGTGFVRVDLTDYGQTLDALLGVTARHTGLDALVHLAAIPVNGLVPDVTTFHNNMTVSFNVMFGAHRAGIRTIVYASSITAMGFPFEEAPPALPVDETYTAANNTYGPILDRSAAASAAAISSFFMVFSLGWLVLSLRLQRWRENEAAPGVDQCFRRRIRVVQQLRDHLAR